MFSRLLRPPASSFLLLGPRGTGKSTWLAQHFAHALTFDLLNETLYQELLSNPSLFFEQCRTRAPKSWIVVDEVQRLPNLLNEVHRLIEQKRLRVALIGSSARKLRSAGTNLLGGRALRRVMYPFVPEELGRAFRLDEVLRHGSLPLVVEATSPADTLRSYVQLYMKEEIQAEALVRSLPGFARFLPIAALFHGQTLNISNIARDAGVARTTVQGYLEILEDTLLVRRLAAFEGHLRVREKKLPKLYFVDPGIVRALRKKTGAVDADEKGSLFEGLIFMILCLYQDYEEIFDDIAYWAPAEAKATEVDFVLVRGKKKVAIEVKSSTNVSTQHLKGLRAIAGLAGLERRILVYPGTRKRLTEDKIEVVPFADFCRDLRAL